ncbi:putative RNA polymerase II subunit B1 CTD phosphatase rpap2 [Neosynchiropus ocellatus]
MEARSIRASKKSKKGDAQVKALSAEEEARRRESIREALREKLELEQRALKVVESLIEEGITEGFLLECACFITPANYKDVVEERSISKLCGYPICLNKLSKVPSQQYKISTKTNKVYDITERKCFCSNFCYKASKQFELQISKTPLWLRKHESPPHIKLMKRGESGSFGEEVLLSERRLQEDDIENPEVAAPADSQQESATDLPPQSDGSDDENDQDFVSSVVSQRQKPKVHWGDLSKRSDKNNEMVKKEKEIETTPCPKDGQEDERTDCFINQTEENEKPLLLDASGEEKEVEVATRNMEKVSLQTHAQHQTEISPNPAEPVDSAPSCDPGLSIVQVSMSRRGAVGLRNLLKNYCAEVKPDSVRLNLLRCLRTTITEWATDETLRFLYGDGYSKKDSRVIEHVEEEELDEDDLDVEDVTQEEKKAAGEGAPSGVPSGATPDYDALKREAELMQLQVREFYKGTWVLPEESSDKVGQRAPALPLVDSKAQHAIQKRITVEKLTSCLRIFVGPLGLTMSDVISDLNNLVRTFRFTNKNIIHKTPEWTLIAVVLLHLLSEVSPVILEALRTTSSVEYLNTLMEELGLQEQDLLSLVQMLKIPSH